MRERLNFHHLFYFWSVVREGSVSAASRKLEVAQPTVSEQLRQLEQSLEVELFQRRGGRLVLTEEGNHVMRYADEIFSLGRELSESLTRRLVARRSRVVIGVADVVPKLIVAKLLAPAIALDPQLHLICHEDRHEKLLSDLALYELDLVLTDSAVHASSNFRGYTRLLSDSGVALFAESSVATNLRKRFPESLADVPLLLPLEHTGLRVALTRWFDAHGVQPRIRGEFQDSALAMVFGREGRGVLAAPTAIAEQMRQHYGLALVAELEGVRARFYAVTAERKVAHPSVRAIVGSTRAYSTRH
ncbi:MAG TPA: LysR family transcriptional regulator [Polyangiales bacterium]|nr:LysR family transcriptional regulator [Polyangiales bacterium]